MRFTTLKLLPATALLLLGALGLLLPRLAVGTQPYNNPGPFTEPWLSPTGAPSLPSPAKVPGKEYSHNLDSTTIGAVGAPPPADAEQVIDWDGLGGTMDGIDYSDSSRPDYPVEGQVDALANFADTLFQETLDDKAHLVFSISSTTTDLLSHSPVNISSSAPIALTNGQTIGGAGELSFELAGAYAAPSSQGLWANQATINAMPGPTDLDALELWGPEPDLSSDPLLLGDSNRYSLENDADSGVSVWLHKKNPDNSYTSLPYVSHSLVVAAVVNQLGPAAGIDEQELASLIDVDALMAYDMPGTNTREFDGLDPVDGPWDRILFSIRQIVDTNGYYATGSEIFWLDASGASGFLHHGGHDWDRTYAFSHFFISTDEGFRAVIDINALEAVAAIPEPCTAALLLVALTVLGCWSRQRKSS